MIRILLDTNVILDALLDRQPWAAEAKTIWAAHLEGQLAAHVTTTSLTDVSISAVGSPVDRKPGKLSVPVSINSM